MNLTLRISDIFCQQDFTNIKLKNFLGDWTDSFSVNASIVFNNSIFKYTKKRWKNSYAFWKINKLIPNKRKYRLPNLLYNNLFLLIFEKNIWHYYKQ